jgi:hypothetical protein
MLFASKATLVAIALVTLSTGSARADGYQDMMGGSWRTMAGAAISTQMWQSIWHGSEEDRVREAYERSHAKRAAAPEVTTTFTAGLQRQVVTDFPLAKRAQATQVLATCDKIYAGFSQAPGGTPFPLNDLAYSTAFMIALNHYVYWDGVAGAPASAQSEHMKVLADRIRSGLLAGGKLAGKTDAQKQTMHDSMLLSACLPFLAYKQSKNASDEPGKHSSRMLAGQMLAKARLDPRALEFRADGTFAVSASGR